MISKSNNAYDVHEQRLASLTSSSDEQSLISSIDEQIDQILMSIVDQQSGEQILMCRAEVGCATEPYDCL